MSKALLVNTDTSSQNKAGVEKTTPAKTHRLLQPWQTTKQLLLSASFIGCFWGNLPAVVLADALPQRINFQHLLENKDIVLGEVAAIIQDSQGFMWFGGSNALIRYDGYNFKSVPITEQGDNGPEELPVKTVFDIIEDSDKTLWISTRTGLLRYNPRTELLTRIPDDPSAGVPITSSDIVQAMEIPSGELLLSSRSGLFVVNRKTGTYTVIVPDPNKKDGIHHKRVQATHIDAAGNLWVGTEAGLEKLDWATKTFTLYKPYPEDINVISANSVTGITSDTSGNLWLATFNGLVYFNPTTQERTRYINDPNDRNSLGGNDIWTLLLDSTGALWITSDGGGVSVFERDKKYPNGRFINHKYEAGRLGSINSNQVRTVFEDRTGDIWVGNYPDGINFFDRSSAAITSYTHDPANPNSLSHNSVLSMREDAKGNLWLGTDGGGLNYYDREQDSFMSYQNNPNDETTISSNAVLTTFIDEQGDVWVGTWGGGISRLNPTTGKFTQLPFDDQRPNSTSINTSKRLNNAHVWSIKEDSQKNLWIATHASGLSKYDRTTETYTHYWPVDSDPQSILSGITWDTFEDSKGNFWVGTSAGLELMDREKGTFKHFITNPQDPTSLSNPSVLAMFEDSQKRLWFGTDAGLNLLNKDGKSFTVYNKANGFNNDTIRQILEDGEGRLWLSTNNGVSLFDPETLKIKNYNRDSGRLVGGFHTDSGLITHDGEIVFGGIEGVRFYSPKKLRDNKAIPPIVLTDFKIFADSINVGAADGLLPQSINYTKTITLDYKKSMFAFDFSALNYRDSGKNNYSYKLEGFDTDWLKVGDQRSAKYTNLNAGKYVFHVKGTNNDGIWNEEGTSITIIQLPPPWKTGWAYSLYILSILAVIGWFILHQRHKRKLIEEQNHLLEAKVNERTAELRQKNHDIQAMLENMPQGLFTVQAGEIIHPEYSLYLEEIFETKDIAGRKAGELLFSGSDIGSDALDSANNAIFAIVGEDEMNYEFNKSLLVSEYSIKVGYKTKFLALDWNPILIDDTVNKLMVSVRDVTELKEMEKEALGQKRELDIISQLLNLSSEKVLGFEESATRYINHNQDVIENTEARDETVIALLFRNMHTIKGNCRTYGFNHLSDVVHEVESTYSALKNSADMPWNPNKLLDDLELVRKALAEYSDVYRRVLGRGDADNSDRHDGFWMSGAIMNKIQYFAENNKNKELNTYIARIQSSNINDVLIDVVSSLSSIASQLGKLTPTVTFNTPNIRIKNTGFELLTDVFAHILRNCVDHGIEPPNERVEAGKDERGTILINAMVVEDKLHIFINDDGRGINICRLFKKGIELKKWDAQSKPSNQEVAELVFCSGVSTKEAVTDISGRGVGMDAVKQFLTAQGGNVQLILQNTRQSSNGYVPFELLVTLPSNLFIKLANDEIDNTQTSVQA